LDYNNYLNDVEDITFNLINKIDVEESEAKLASYASSHGDEIIHNATVASQEAENFSAVQAAEREQGKMRREAARREEEEEKREKREGRQNVLNRLAAGANVREVEEEGHKVHLKKRLDRKEQAERQRQLTASAADIKTNGSGFTIKGLKTRKPPEKEKPFDPFESYKYKAKNYQMMDRYEWSWLNDLRDNTVIQAGGYDIQEFHARALCEAFSGLGVFVMEEKKDVDLAEGVFNTSAVSTAAAADVAMS